MQGYRPRCQQKQDLSTSERVRSSISRYRGRSRIKRKKRTCCSDADDDVVQSEKFRARGAERARRKRARESPTETAARRLREAQRARERRARMTPEQMEAARQRAALLKRKLRSMETEEQRALRRSQNAQRARERRASVPTTKKTGSPCFLEPVHKTDSEEGDTPTDPLRLPAVDNTESTTNTMKHKVATGVNDVISTLSETLARELARTVKMEAKESGDIVNCGKVASVQCDGETKYLPAETDGQVTELKCSESLNKNSRLEGDDAVAVGRVKVSDCGDDPERNINDAVLKIIPIETLLKETPQPLPKFVAEKSESVSSCGKMVVEEEKRGSLQCNICSKFLSSQSNLRLHKIKRHKVKTPFCCKVCGLQFDYCREVVQHRNKVHRNKEGLFECDCGKTTYEFHNFLTHLAGHRKRSNKEPLDTKDGDVGPMFIGDKTKDDKKEFICEYCGKKFKRPDSLKTHLNLIHMEDGGEMAERMKHSAQERNFVCDTCGRRFSFQCLLRDHLNLHTGVKPYVCSECDRAFSQKASLLQHVKAHSAERRFKCVECPAAFLSRGDLTKHVRKHTGERPYICEVCGEGYAQSSHLNVHKRSHSGERPFSCDLCGRAFTKSSDVARHRRIHTGELPFLCQVCGKAFRQSAQCQNHIKNHHPETIPA